MSLFSQSDAIFAVTIPTVACSCPKKASINSPNFKRIHVGFLLNSISSILESKYRLKLYKFCNTVDFVPVTQFRHYRNENAPPVNVRTVSQFSDHVTSSDRDVAFGSCTAILELFFKFGRAVWVQKLLKSWQGESVCLFNVITVHARLTIHMNFNRYYVH